MVKAMLREEREQSKAVSWDVDVSASHETEVGQREE